MIEKKHALNVYPKNDSNVLGNYLLFQRPLTGFVTIAYQLRLDVLRADSEATVAEACWALNTITIKNQEKMMYSGKLIIIYRQMPPSGYL